MVNVSNISACGVWLMAADRELFLAYRRFPQFKSATVRHILNVRESQPGQFHWPDLDVRLTAEAIENPDRFVA